MAENYEAKARDLAAQGDKKLRSFGFFGNKWEDAGELYEKAANQFKLAKACEFAAGIGGRGAAAAHGRRSTRAG